MARLKMLGKTEVFLAAGIVLSTIAPTWAAPRHRHPVTDLHPTIYNKAAPALAGGGCPANGGPGCSTEFG
jgi:hypothetical protein